ncbi:uncharacterized protein LOC135819580 [Sycon ciliatum]|uniref:uncharacterized protein LOC135819580 n=1 Tax=Sycon ciliatum TaxID=27933 RepID=UPI0020ACD066|eukprot:scpid51291/ scgid12396/ Asialoglycoprotein receptor 2; Hepatic lectin R2/3
MDCGASSRTGAASTTIRRKTARFSPTTRANSSGSPRARFPRRKGGHDSSPQSLAMAVKHGKITHRIGKKRLGTSSSVRSWIHFDHQSVVLCLLIAFLSTQLTFEVGAAAAGCPDADFKQFGSVCYSFRQTRKNYFTAHVSCRGYNDGYLAVVSTREQYNFVREMIENGTRTGESYEVWIGLTDKDEEGIYRWVGQGSTAAPANFPGELWAPGQPGSRGQDHDCATMQSDGVHISTLGCSEDSGLFYVCEQLACVGTCAQAVIGTGSGTSGGVIAAIVIVVLLVIIIALGLFYIWKFKNDKWERYVCYLCTMRESNTKVHSLQQENQRLRRQLSNQRSVSQISLSGLNDVVPGPTDGDGGVLPTLRPMAQVGASSPVPVSPTGQFSSSPPPLRRQSTSQASGNGPMLTRNSSTFSTGGLSRPGNLPMSRQTSTLSTNRGRIVPTDAGNPQGGPAGMGINSPRNAFAGPPQFASAGPPRVNMSRNSSTSSGFGGTLGLPSPQAKKVSVVQEDPDAEEQEAAELEGRRSSVQASPLPGRIEE